MSWRITERITDYDSSRHALPLEDSKFSQPVKKFHALNGNQKFMRLHESGQWSLSAANSLIIIIIIIIIIIYLSPTSNTKIYILAETERGNP